MPNARQLTLIGFLQAQNCSNYPASWRHPDAATDFLTPAYYQRIARTLEAGKFHMAFFDDRLAMPDRYADTFVETVRHGIRAVKLDPIPLAMLRQMNQSSMLGLFEDEDEEEAASADQVLPDHASIPANETLSSSNDDPDLRLQQDDAAGRPGPDQGARP